MNRNNLIFSFIIVLIFLLCLLASTSGAQTWERAFGFVSGKEEGANTICKLLDGNFIAGGYAEEIGIRPARIIKINSLGDTLWSKRIIVPNCDYTIIKSSLALDDGSFLISGYCEINPFELKALTPSSFVAKLNSNGDIIWSKCFYSYGIYDPITNIIKANDSGFLCSSRENILKINESGDYLWSKPSSYYGYTSIYIFKAFDLNSYICGLWNYPSSGISLLKINNLGEQIWSKPPNQILPEYIIPQQNKFFLLGSDKDTSNNSLILRIQTYDTLGNFMLEKNVNVHREEITDGFYLPVNSNRIMISSHSLYLTQDTFYCAIRLVDTNMNVIRTLNLTTKGGFRGLYSAVMQDGKYFLAAGNISMHLGYGYEDFYVIKSDTNLNLQVSIGIRKIDTEIPKEINLYPNYPNPFNPITKIKFSVPEESFVKIEIYDVTGRLIDKIIDKEMKAGVYETGWNGSSYPSGAYFCKMTAGNYVKTVRMVLVK